MTCLFYKVGLNCIKATQFRAINKREADHEKNCKVFGLDVHKKSIAIAIAEEERQRDVHFYDVINNDMDQFHKFLRKQISQGAEPRGVYEVGPCGYNIYRSLSDRGLYCSVVAPSLIPRKSGDRIKIPLC